MDFLDDILSKVSFFDLAFVIITILSTIFPAIRASNIDPIVSLKNE